MIDFSQTDQGGRLFYSRVFELAHHCLESFAEEKGVHKKWFQDLEWMSPIRAAEAKYTKPILLGDRVEVELRVVEQTKHSITWGFDFLVKNRSSDPCCHVEMSQVFLDSDGKKTELPEELRASLPN
jgi:acyl-CoA thioesterase FadM